MELRVYKTKPLRMGVDSPLEELGGLQSMRHKDSDTTEHTRTHKHKILPQSLQEDKLTPPDFRLTATKSERNKFLLSQQPQVGGLKQLMPSWNSAQCYVVPWRGEEFGETGDMYNIGLSPLRCSPKTITTLLIGYTPI